MSLAQLYLNRGNISESIKIISSIVSLKHKFAIVATLVSLCEQINNVETAIKIFDDFTLTLEVIFVTVIFLNLERKKMRKSM